ncbi:MAG: hypothetical protein AAB443_03785 [Patescibacteria group bacterium]
MTINKFPFEDPVQGLESAEKLTNNEFEVGQLMLYEKEGKVRVCRITEINEDNIAKVWTPQTSVNVFVEAKPGETIPGSERAVNLEDPTVQALNYPCKPVAEWKTLFQKCGWSSNALNSLPEMDLETMEPVTLSASNVMTATTRATLGGNITIVLKVLYERQLLMEKAGISFDTPEPIATAKPEPLEISRPIRPKINIGDEVIALGPDGNPVIGTLSRIEDDGRIYSVEIGKERELPIRAINHSKTLDALNNPSKTRKEWEDFMQRFGFKVKLSDLPEGSVAASKAWKQIGSMWLVGQEPLKLITAFEILQKFEEKGKE